jgi:hypothetical protein
MEAPLGACGGGGMHIALAQWLLHIASCFNKFSDYLMFKFPVARH